MNYIPFPRIDLDSHTVLTAWRSKQAKKDGDWTALKGFLADSARIAPAKHAIPKCWYSELPQGDDYALDVEHYRPKGSGSPLTQKHIDSIKKQFNIVVEQEESGGQYDWLKFDYRNYRLVTAKPNRAGAKHIYFPIAKGTDRLEDASFPWIEQEYSYFLDPTDRTDAGLLFVKPNGEIAPIAPCIQLTDRDYQGLPATWRNDGFNYLRAAVTICAFRLNDSGFIQGRKDVYDEMIRRLENLDILLLENPRSALVPRLTEDIVLAVLPSAQFSLAAKSALSSFQASRILQGVIGKIQSSLETRLSSIAVDWGRP